MNEGSKMVTFHFNISSLFDAVRLKSVDFCPIDGHFNEKECHSEFFFSKIETSSILICLFVIEKGIFQCTFVNCREQWCLDITFFDDE